MAIPLPTPPNDIKSSIVSDTNSVINTFMVIFLKSSLCSSKRLPFLLEVEKSFNIVKPFNTSENVLPILRYTSQYFPNTLLIDMLIIPIIKGIKGRMTIIEVPYTQDIGEAKLIVKLMIKQIANISKGIVSP